MADFINLLRRVEEESIRRDKEIIKKVDFLVNYHNQEVRRQVTDVMKELITHSYSKASTYTNVVIVAGYVVFFTIWNSLKTSLSPFLALTSALCLTLSAVIFVLFEVYKMISTSVHIRKLSKLLNQEDPQKIIADSKREILKVERIGFKVWLIALLPTVVFGLAGASILLYGFLSNLISFLPALSR